ncbi:MAG: hypothetical protein ACK4SQ_16000 [Allorhizobium sp.]
MTNSVIGALRVNLGLDSAEFQDGMKRAQSDTDKFASALKTGFAAAAAAAAAGLAAVSVAVRQNLNSFDELSKTSQKIGIPVEELSKLKYAADLSGVSMEGMQTAVSKLSKNMVEASKGSGKMAQTFGQLGITLKNSDGSLRSSSVILTELSDKFAAMPDGAQKTALAMQLLGKSGADLIPLLNGGSDALGGLLNEAKMFGLEVSTETARMAEAVNDNFARVSYAISGLGVQLTATLAPILLQVSNAMVAMAETFIGALQYLPQVAEAVTVVGGALAIAFAPAILAAVGNLTLAIGVGMVGAVKTLTAVMLANPLGAFAVAVAAAITAAYYFRDEIQKAIGLDVVGIAVDAANAILNSFEACFYDIKFVWEQFPNIIGAAVIGATNIVIEAVNRMVDGAKRAVNDLIGLMNGIPFVDIGALSTGGDTIGKMDNPFASSLANAVGTRNADISRIMGQNKVAQIGAAFKASTPAVQEFGNALAGANTQLDTMGGGGGGGGGKGKSGNKLDKVKENVKGAASEMQKFGESIASTLASSFGSLLDGSKKLRDVVSDLLKQLGQMALNSAFKALASGFGGGGGGGGFFGTLLSGIGSIFGFARGGTIMPGGAGGIDSQLVTFRKSPNERVDITKPGQTLTSGRGGVADVRVYVDQNGNWQAAVERISDERVGNAAPAIVGQANRMVMPTMARFQSQKAGGDYRNG